MIDRENIIQDLRSIKTYLASQAAEATKDGNILAKDGLVESQKVIDKVIALMKEQEQTIEALKEKLRLLEYGNHDCVQDVLMPAT
jgi:hypothetical protein